MKYFLTPKGINMVNDDAADRVRQNYPQFKEVDIFVGEDNKPSFIFKEASDNYKRNNPKARQYQYGMYSSDMAPEYENLVTERTRATRSEVEAVQRREREESVRRHGTDGPARNLQQYRSRYYTGEGPTPSKTRMHMAKEMADKDPFLALDEMLSANAGNAPKEIQQTQQRARVHRERIKEHLEPYSMGMDPKQYQYFSNARDWATEHNGLQVLGENVLMGAFDLFTSTTQALNPGGELANFSTYERQGVNSTSGMVGQLLNSVAYSMPQTLGMVAMTMASGGLGSLAGKAGLSALASGAAKAGSIGLQAAGYGMTGAQMLAPLNKDDYDKGRLDFTNILVNVLSASAQTAVEYINLGNQMGSIQKAWQTGGKAAISQLAQGYVKDALEISLKQFGKPILMSGLQEGTEEVIQGMTEKMFNVLKGDTLPDPEEWAKELALSFAGGLLGGLAFGTVGSGIQLSINNKVAKTLQYNASRYPNSVAHLNQAAIQAQNKEFEEARQSLMEFEKGNAYDKVTDANIEKAYNLISDAIRMHDVGLVIEYNSKRRDQYNERRQLRDELSKLQDKANSGTISEQEADRIFIIEDKLSVIETAIQERIRQEDNVKSLREIQELAKEVGILNARIKKSDIDSAETNRMIQERDDKLQELMTKKSDFEQTMAAMIQTMPKSEQRALLGEKYPAHQTLNPQETAQNEQIRGDQEQTQPGTLPGQTTPQEHHGNTPKVLTAEEREAQRKGIQIEQSKGMKAGDVNNMIDRRDPSSLEDGTKPVTGKETQVRTSPNRKVNTRWMLIKLKDLVVSNDPTTFSENPEYPGEIQNRKRDRAALREQVENIAKNPDPELLADNPLGQYGAPVIFRDNEGRWVVLGGNGRIMGLKRRAALMGAESLQEYEAFVKDRLTELGFDPDTDTTGMVLVRTYYGNDDVIEMSRELNSSETAELSPMEQASGDAVTIANAIRKGNNILEDLVEGQPLTPDKQEAFYNSFYSLCVKDGNQYKNNEGYTTRMQDRVEMAMWMYLFNGHANAEELLSAYFETEKSNIKSIITGVVDNLSVIIALRRLTERHNLPDYDISQTLLKAMTEISALRAKGINLEKILVETDIFSENQQVVPEDKVELYRALLTIKSMKAGRAFFGGYYGGALNGLDPNQENIFSLEDSTPAEYLQTYLEEWIANEERKKAERAAARANQKSDPASLDTSGDAKETAPTTRQSRNLQNQGFPGRAETVQSIKNALGFKEKTDSISYSDDGSTITFDTADGRHVILNLHQNLIQGTYGPAAGQMSRTKINGKITYVIDLVEALNSGNRSGYHEAFHMAWFMSTTVEQRQYLERYYTKLILSGQALDENGQTIEMTKEQWDSLNQEEKSVYIEEQAAMGSEAFWGSRGDMLPGLLPKIWQRFWDRIRMGLVAIGWASETMKLDDIFVRAGTGKLGGAGIDMNVEVRNKYLGSKIVIDPVKFIDKQIQGGDGRYNQGYVEVEDIDGRSIRIPVGESWTVIENGKPVEKGYGLVHAQKHQDINGKSIVRALKEGSREVRKNQANYILKLNDEDTIKVGTSRGWDGDDDVNVMLTAFIYERDGRIKTKALTQSAEEMPDKPRPSSTRPAGSDSKTEDKRQADSEKSTRKDKRYKLVPTQKQANDVIGLMYARGRNLIEQKLPNRFSKDTLRNMISKDMKDDEFLAFQLEDFLQQSPGMISKEELNKWMDRHEYKIKVQVLSGNNRNEENNSKYDTYSSRFGEDYREYIFKSSAAEGYWAPHFSKANIVMHMRLSDVDKSERMVVNPSKIVFNNQQHGWDNEDELVMLTAAISNKIEDRYLTGGPSHKYAIIKHMLLSYKYDILEKRLSKEEAALNAHTAGIRKFREDLSGAVTEEYLHLVSETFKHLLEIVTIEMPNPHATSQRPGLIIEEMQSDFHQTAREQGYRDSDEEAETAKKLQELDKKQQKILREYGFSNWDRFLNAENNVSTKVHDLEHKATYTFPEYLDKISITTGGKTFTFKAGEYNDESFYEMANKTNEMLEEMTYEFNPELKRPQRKSYFSSEKYRSAEQFIRSYMASLISAINSKATDSIGGDIYRTQEFILERQGYNDIEANHLSPETKRRLARERAAFIDKTAKFKEYLRSLDIKTETKDNSKEYKTMQQQLAEARQEQDRLAQARNALMQVENQKTALNSGRKRLPNLPLKKFHEFLFKYALLESAQKGYGDIYWTTGTMQSKRYGFDEERDAGMKGFYDKIVVDFANKLGKRYGVKADVVNLNAPEAHRGMAEFNHLTITPEMRQDMLQQGLPRYKMAPQHTKQWTDGTGDIVSGDHIRFTEAVFSGSYKSPKYAGDRTIEAIVTKDSYGQDKQQHTFTMVVVSSSGEEALKPGDTIRRKGRNVYKNGTERLLWKDETQRNAAADEKHSRGDQARAAREQRRNERFKQAPDTAEIAEAERQMEEVRSKYEGTDQWLKAPNGKPTKLTERQWLQVRTDNFKKWFGDWENDPKNASKVIDENGEPMVVYHGTDADFTEFIPQDGRFGSFYGTGFYFSQRPTGYFGKKTMPVFLNIRNMAKFDDDMTARIEEYDLYDVPFALDNVDRETYRNLREYIEDNDGAAPLWQGAGHVLNPDRMTKHMLSKGYDGAEIDSEIPSIFIENSDDLWGKEYVVYGSTRISKTSSYIHFNKDGSWTEIPNTIIVPGDTQIKSAVANVGTFDAENPDIRYKLVDDDLFKRLQETPPLPVKPWMKYIKELKETGKLDHEGYTKSIQENSEAYEEALKAWAEQAPDMIPLKADFGTALISKDPSQEDPKRPWRATWFNNKLEPSGHKLYTSKYEAVKDTVSDYREFDPNTRFKMIPEEMLKRMEAAIRLADTQSQDAVIDQTVARTSEQKGIDQQQVKEKVGRAIRAAYREGTERIQNVLAASTIAGIDRYIETNKPETRDRSDLTYHLEEAEEDAYQNDLGISVEQAMALGEDRFNFYLGGLKIFARGNAIMEELMKARQESAKLREQGMTDEALEEKIALLTGMAIQSKLAYDNIKGNAGRILRHAREEKAERARQFTELVEQMQQEEAELYKQIDELQAEIDAQEQLLAELEQYIAELESVHTDLIESSDDLLDKVNRVLDGTRFKQVDRLQRIELMQQRQAEMRRRHELNKERIQNMIQQARATQERVIEIGNLIDDQKPDKPPRITDLPKISPTLYHYTKSAMYMGMLSSPMTHYRNIVGNLTSLASELLVDIVTDPKGGLIALINTLGSVPDSARAAKDTFNDPKKFTAKYDLEDSQFHNKLMKFYTTITRILAAEDAFAYNMALTAQLASIAVMESKKPENIKAGIS